jgi:condensin complex subunit 2
LHDGDHRFSSSSFAPARVSFSSFGNVDNNSNLEENNTPTITEPRQSSRPLYSQASVLLDAIASGDISTQQHNHYEYFNSQALKNLSSGNLWAGAEHWKKMPSSRRRNDGSGVKNGIHSSKSNDVHDDALTASKKKKGLKGKTKSSTYNTFPLVSLSTTIEKLETMLEKPKLKRGKNVTDPLQFTKAMRTKHSNIDNLLPMDAGLGVQEFITLFSRPNVILVDFVKTKNHEADVMNVGKSAKVVGFCCVQPLETDDASGIGFNFGGSDDGYDENEDLNEFVVPALEDVRRVDKINIGYATVARKVDVKRLKRDLWNELEHTFSSRKPNDVLEEVQREEGKDDTENLSVYNRDLGLSVSNNDNAGKNANDDDGQKVATANDVTKLSFQDTVRYMQTNQSQSDVTVPFYFICLLHLCNEKGLALESSGLDDFVIHSS